MNLILQHWHGPATDFERASWESIRLYAKRIGAKHEVIRGAPMGLMAHPPMHKLYMLLEEWDNYETVVMLDSDIFASPAQTDSVFNVQGVGVTGPLQHELRTLLRRRLPYLFANCGDGDYYGGAIYKLRLHERKNMRKHINRNILQLFDNARYYRDEGAMHFLASKAKMAGKALPGGETWACSSFDKNVRKAKLVHVRNRIEAGKEARQSKEQALENLIKDGVLSL